MMRRFGLAPRALQRTFDFSGTAGRAEFWAYFSLILVASVVFGTLSTTISSPTSANGVGVVLPWLLSLPLWSPMVRRLHDADLSGWWISLALVPLLGDNRDNATDSRVAQPYGPGMVPIENVIGRAGVVLFSSSGTSFMHAWDWRPGRYLVNIK